MFFSPSSRNELLIKRHPEDLTPGGPNEPIGAGPYLGSEARRDLISWYRLSLSVLATGKRGRATAATCFTDQVLVDVHL